MNLTDAPLLPLRTRVPLRARRDQLDTLLDEAARPELNRREARTFLCQAEVAGKEERRWQLAPRLATFPFLRTGDGFDGAAQPSLEPQQLRELALCRWGGQGDCLRLLGPPGVGKPHLAVAWGRAAIQRGYAVRLTPATALVRSLATAHSDGRLEARLAPWSKPTLLRIDELGSLPFEPNAAPLGCQLVAPRYSS